MSHIYQAANVIRGTKANLEATNSVFPDNTLIIETDTGMMRMADGTTAYPSLPAAIGGWFTKSKEADTSRASNATLANDPDLLFAMLANTKYAFRLSVFYDTAAAADFKYAIDAPASPTIFRATHQSIDPGALTTLGSTSVVAEVGSTALAAGAGTTGGIVRAEGIIHNGVNAGNLAFQWAQNTSDVGPAIVRAGSYIEYRVV